MGSPGGPPSWRCLLFSSGITCASLRAAGLSLAFFHSSFGIVSLFFARPLWLYCPSWKAQITLELPYEERNSTFRSIGARLSVILGLAASRRVPCRRGRVRLQRASPGMVSIAPRCKASMAFALRLLAGTELSPITFDE